MTYEQYAKLSSEQQLEARLEMGHRAYIEMQRAEDKNRIIRARAATAERAERNKSADTSATAARLAAELMRKSR